MLDRVARLLEAPRLLARGTRLGGVAFCHLTVLANLVPRSLVDEVEGEIWPNPICIR